MNLACSLHVQSLVSILGLFDTLRIGHTLVVEQVDNEVQPILLELSSSIENSRDLDQHQRFGVACTRQASGMVHIVCKVTVQRSGGLGFCLADSTQFRYVLNSVSQIFAEKNFKKADSSHRLWRLCSLCSSFGVLEPCIQFGNLRANSPFSPRAFIRTFSCFWCTSTSSLPFKQDIVLLFEFAITLFLLIKIQQQRPRTSEIAGYIKICTLMVYKPRLVAL